MEIINGREVKTKLLEDLLRATKENTEVMTEQNRKMVTYTKWIFIFTIIVTVCTIIQLVIAFKAHPFSG